MRLLDLTALDAVGLVVAVLAAVGVAVLCRRWGVWRWLAVAAAVPALLVTAQEAGVAAPVGLTLVVWSAVAAGWTAWPGSVPLVVSLLLLVAGGSTVRLAGVTGRSVTHGPVLWTLLGAALLLALAGAVGLGRSRLLALRVVTLVVAGVPVLFFVGTRSTDAMAALWPVAGVLGLTGLLRGSRGAAAVRSQSDDVDAAALADFDQRYETPTLAPVVVLIAAYDEESGLPGVLGTLPASACGLDVDVLVVDDGSADATADVAERADTASGHAYVVRCTTNRGQGAALRLGYRVAREHGASYVVTTDADGQYDVGDLPTMLAPLLEDRADFVTGSRRRGHQPVQDPVRRLGVHVFAATMSVLVGRRVTDTSFGMRAMRAEATAAVTLNQPQYQSSELMLGMYSHGFRVLEVPGTMHARGSGVSKKGKNWFYGRRYAGVVLGTWWREGLPTPVDRCAAVRGSQHHAPARPDERDRVESVDRAG